MSKVTVETHFKTIIEDVLDNIPSFHYNKSFTSNYYVWIRGRFLKESTFAFKIGWEKYGVEDKSIFIDAQSKNFWGITKKVINELEKRLPDFNIIVTKYFISNKKVKNYLGEDEDE